MRTPSSIPPSRRRPLWRALFATSTEAYSVRMMATLSMSLLLIALCFRFYPTEGPVRIGWKMTASERMSFLELNPERPQESASSGVPITTFGEQKTAEGEPPIVTPQLEAEPEPPPDEPSRATSDVRRMDVLEFAEVAPQIEGGLGAYYIHIEYPDAARHAGIEGRLVLAFVVEPDGSTSHVEIMQPLHPLCDSAAVRALRKTHFVPGRQGGEAVPVKMRLPVRFKLIRPEATDDVTLSARTSDAPRD